MLELEEISTSPYSEDLRKKVIKYIKKRKEPKRDIRGFWYTQEYGKPLERKVFQEGHYTARLRG